MNLPRPLAVVTPAAPRPVYLPLPHTPAPAPVPLPKLAYSRDEAAEAIGISVRTLDSWTKAGTVPHARLGGRVVYPVAALSAWLVEQTSPARTPDVSPAQ